MMAAIVGVMSLLGVVAIGIVLALARILVRRQDNGPMEDEARLVQDMYRTLARLENRVEVLETLLAGKAADSAVGPDPGVRGV
jgi:hypothetical protein